MNEVRALVEAFDAAIAAGERCALATIVSVEGSSYRRPGARMLICESGSTTGMISAGCLESDVIEHAKRVLHADEAKLIKYDNGSTTEEMAWGLGLGCNGIVRVLVEPLASDSLYIEALRNTSQMRPDAPGVSVVTVYEPPASSNLAIGARIFIGEQGDVGAEKLNGAAAWVLEEVRSKVNSPGDYSFDIEGSTAKVFVEKLLPPIPLVIFGAGNDALPIVELARGLGWQTEVIDSQERAASRARFEIADRVTLARSEDIDRHVTITPQTMALVMSHDYSHDIAALKLLLQSPALYIGVMGPRKRTERMLAELATGDEAFQVDENHLARIYSPVGLDIGANGSMEIALSIIGEMRAVLAGRHGGMLRSSRGPIQNSTNETSSNLVGAVILAAGSSSRMGRPKQALKFGESSLLRRSALAALEAGCSPVIVVTGANAEASRQELDGLDVREVWNPKWETGMGSSIATGIKDLLDANPKTTATVMMLCDQPFVTADVISRLVAAHRLMKNSVIGSRYGEGFGVPALFKRSLFDELALLDGSAGAKAVIIRHESEAHFITFPDGEIDVDTPDDYARLISNEIPSVEAI